MEGGEKMNSIIEADRARWKGKKNLFILPQFKFVKLKRKCEYWKRKNKLIYA